MRRVLLALIVTLIAGMLTACGDIEHDEALVGNWVYSEIAGWQYEFNGDGTGQRGQLTEIQAFDWHTKEGNRVMLDLGAAFQKDDWQYSIAGDTLIVKRKGTEESYSYFRVQNSPAFVGSWEWEHDDTYIISFNEDGSGTRGFSPEMEAFEWFNTEDCLYIDAGTIKEELWGFTASDNALTIDSRQVDDMTYSFTR